jgi:hypothetical protein
MEQFPWEASSQLRNSRLLCNPKAHYRVHNSPRLVPNLSYMHPAHIFTTYFPKIHSNIILSSTRRFSEWLFSSVISVGFWRWCVGIERIVLLDFIHRLVSQKIEELKIYIPKNHNIHVQNSHKGQLLTTEPLTWVHTQHKPLRQVRHRWQ